MSEEQIQNINKTLEVLAERLGRVKQSRASTQCQPVVHGHGYMHYPYYGTEPVPWSRSSSFVSAARKV